MLIVCKICSGVECIFSAFLCLVCGWPMAAVLMPSAELFRKTPSAPSLCHSSWALWGSRVSLNGGSSVGRPGEVLRDEDSQEFEGPYPLHPIYAERGRDDVAFPPEVRDDLFGFCGAQWEVVHRTPSCQALYLISVCHLISSWDEPHNCCVISKFDEDVWQMGWCAVVGVLGVEHWAQHAALRHTGA